MQAINNQAILNYFNLPGSSVTDARVNYIISDGVLTVTDSSTGPLKAIIVDAYDKNGKRVSGKIGANEGTVEIATEDLDLVAICITVVPISGPAADGTEYEVQTTGTIQAK